MHYSIKSVISCSFIKLGVAGIFDIWVLLTPWNISAVPEQERP
jgi:hypothetical protein